MRLLIAELVSQVSTVLCHMAVPEMNPLMSGDQLALALLWLQPLLDKEKLIIDAPVIRVLRNGEDLRASNWDTSPASLASVACRLNVKYHVFLLIPRSGRERREAQDWLIDFSAAELLADMKNF